jgi:hypothetical protein
VGGGINSALLSGGGIYAAGGTSSLSYQWGQLTLTLADQLGYDGGFPFTYGQVRYSTPVSQWILKNGVHAHYMIWGSCFVDAGVTLTNFLAEAAVHGYVTPGVGIGIKWGPGGTSDFQVDYVGNFGNDSYEDNGVQLVLRLRF